MKHVSRNLARKLRVVAFSTTAVLGLTGLVACGDSTGPETGDVTTDDLQSIEEDIGSMEERIGALEGEADNAVGAEADEVAEGALWEEGESLVGEQATVRAAISEVLTVTDDESAFRIAGDNGEEVAVIRVGPPMELEVNDVVRVSGTVVEIERDTFEEDFGVRAERLFADAGWFLQEAEGNIAIAADEVEILQERSDD